MDCAAVPPGERRRARPADGECFAPAREPPSVISLRVAGFREEQHFGALDALPKERFVAVRTERVDVLAKLRRDALGVLPDDLLDLRVDHLVTEHDLKLGRLGAHSRRSR